MLNVAIKNELLDRIPGEEKQKMVEFVLQSYGMDLSKPYEVERRDEETIYKQDLQPLEFVKIDGRLKL